MPEDLNLPDKIDIRFLLEVAYFKISKKGYNTVSLDDEKISKQVRLLIEILKTYGITDEELFAKAKLRETYDEYKKFLIQALYEEGFAFYDDETNSLIVSCSDFSLMRCTNWAIEYEDLILELCYALTEDHSFIEDRRCADCEYSYYPNYKYCNCELKCDCFDPEKETSENGYCGYHVFKNEWFIDDEDNAWEEEERSRKERFTCLCNLGNNYMKIKK